jgi:hypothetical protein
MEIYKFMVELYLLDRNIVDLMRRYNNSEKIPDKKRINTVSKLRELDIKGNIFSPLLSIIEGKTIKETDSNGKIQIIKTPHREIRRLILNESNIVNSFIKNAGTDCEHLISSVKNISKNIYDAENDTLIDEKIRLVDKLQASIGKIRKLEQRRDAYFEFKEIVNEFSYLKNQPFILVSLMYIFGSQRASKVMKFNAKQFVAYNPIADFNHYKTISQLKFNERIKGKLNVNFLSLDSDMDFIQELFNTTSAKLSKSTNFTDTLSLEWKIKKDTLADEIPEIKGQTIDHCSTHASMIFMDTI